MKSIICEHCNSSVLVDDYFVRGQTINNALSFPCTICKSNILTDGDFPCSKCSHNSNRYID